MKPMKPEDFHRILCEKLEKVVQDQAIDERCKRESEGAHMVNNLCNLFFLDKVINLILQHRLALGFTLRDGVIRIPNLCNF